MRKIIYNKRGISILVGYVLLVVLALGMSAAVYSFLNFYIPKDQPQCENDVSLIIQDVSCQSQKLNVTLLNKGLFAVEGAFIKIGNASEVYKETLTSSDNDLFFVEYGSSVQTPPGLHPGQTVNRSFDYASTGDWELQVEPFVVGEDNEIVLCNKAVVTQIVSCI